MSWPTKVITFSLLAALVGLFSLTGGCSKSGTLDAKTLANYRTTLSLADEPENILTVADVRAELVGEEPHDHDEHSDNEHNHDEEGHDDHDEDAHSEEEHAHEEEHEHDHDEHEEDAQSAAATGPIEVAMVGHVGGLANPWKTQRDYPFDTTKAVFFLADPQTVIENESHGHNHAPGEECAFCAAYAAQNSHMIAMVQLVDKNGKVLPTDIREVFDVKEKDTVVVSGTAQVTEGGMMVVNATGLYIRK